MLCPARKRLEAHHIKRWANNPNLRFQISNGITLCKNCHWKVTGEEEAYEQTFYNILQGTNGISIQKMIREYDI